MNIRRGVSLTELLVVMGTSTVALMAGIGMLRQAMTQHRYAENEFSVHRVAERLTLQFRQDVHAAESVAWSDAANESELRLQVPARDARRCGDGSGLHDPRRRNDPDGSGADAG